MTNVGELAWRLKLPPPIHEAGKAALTGFGALTGAFRGLPDYLIIGAQRCGTTSLSRYLEAHPSVQSPMHKEIHYFDLHFSRGERWYRGHFPTVAYRKLMAARTGVSLTGEASPYYIFHPLAALRVAEVLPAAKLIVAVRDPVTRAISHYHHSRRRGVEHLTFEEALEREPERLAGEEERLRRDPAYDSLNYRYFSYVSRGLYATQLRRWLECFPREQLIVVESDRLRNDPAREYARVLGFLRLPPFDGVDFRRYNEKPRGPVAAATIEKLADLFRPHNDELFALLGDRFDWT